MNTSPQIDERRGDDQDPGLAQRLAEEPQHAQREHVAQHAGDEPQHLAGVDEAVARPLEGLAERKLSPGAHLAIVVIEGWVASSTCVNV